MDFNSSILRRLSPKAVARYVSSLLPNEFKYRLYRNFINVEATLNPAITFSVARSQADLEAAFSLLHDEYVHAGFMIPHASGMRITLYHALPSTSTLVAKYNDEVIATLSIIRDNAFGLPLDKVFETSPLRKHGSRLAEVSSLAIDKRYRRNSGQILFPLLKFMREYCAQFFGVDYLVIAVHPKHFPFYKAILFFKKLTDQVVKNYDFVNGCPAVGGFLDLRTAHDTYAIQYGKQPANKNLFQYFFKLKLPNFNFPSRKYFKVSDPIMTPELLDNFFRKKTDIFATLKDADKEIFCSLFRHDKYRRVLPKYSGTFLEGRVRNQPRFEVNCDAKLCLSNSLTVGLKVTDVSMNGFRALATQPLKFGVKSKIFVAIADFDIADLEGWPTWKGQEEVYGFFVEDTSSNWQKFIHHLDRESAQEYTDPQLASARST